MAMRDEVVRLEAQVEDQKTGPTTDDDQDRKQRKEAMNSEDETDEDDEDDYVDVLPEDLSKK